MRTERPASAGNNRGGLTAGTTTLLLAARDWLTASLEAWAEEDPAAVSTYAPLAVEELARSVLWQLNPVLTIPLDPEHEEDFLRQATTPELEASRARMVDLTQCLSRLENLLDEPFPVSSARVSHVIALRESTLRAIGDDFGRATEVLTACLRLTNWLLDALRCPHGVFYGERAGDVADLLDDQRSDLDRQVSRKLTQARSRVLRLREVSGSQEHFLEVARGMADGVQAGYGRATDGGTDGRIELAVVTICPVCEFGGVTLGVAEPSADTTTAHAGDGGSAGSPGEMWVVPQAFMCGVCRLRITGREELEASPVPSGPRTVRNDELAGLGSGLGRRLLAARAPLDRGRRSGDTH